MRCSPFTSPKNSGDIEISQTHGHGRLAREIVNAAKFLLGRDPKGGTILGQHQLVDPRFNFGPRSSTSIGPQTPAGPAICAVANPCRTTVPSRMIGQSATCSRSHGLVNRRIGKIVAVEDAEIELTAVDIDPAQRRAKRIKIPGSKISARQLAVIGNHMDAEEDFTTTVGHLA